MLKVGEYFAKQQFQSILRIRSNGWRCKYASASNSANSEMTHLDNMHSWIVKFIEKEKKERMEPIPQGMLDVWSWQHEKIIEELTEAKVMLQNYQKV